MERVTMARRPADISDEEAEAGLAEDLRGYRRFRDITVIDAVIEDVQTAPVFKSVLERSPYQHLLEAALAFKRQKMAGDAHQWTTAAYWSVLGVLFDIKTQTLRESQQKS